MGTSMADRRKSGACGLMKTTKRKTPCYIVEESLLRKNLEILKEIMDTTGCHILLAQKAFSMYSLYPLVGEYISGTASSGLYEARLGYEEMGKENHTFAPAFQEEEFPDILKYSDHIIFNSLSQLEKFEEETKKAGKSFGIRINPEFSTQEGPAIYDPCAKGSRLGIPISQIEEEILKRVDGIHFHTLCEQGSEPLRDTLKVVEEKIGKYFHHLKWINLGGGHHITREDYNRDLLKELIFHLKEYGLEVYLEPGEAVALNAGTLETTVLDIIDGEPKIGILDTSAACHMPDVLEMPYRPPLKDSGVLGEKKYSYRFGGPTCLAGDIIGEYSFDKELKSGDILSFQDMAIYTMVKNNTFNGMPLPSIYYKRETGELEKVKEFGYEDFKERLS